MASEDVEVHILPEMGARLDRLRYRGTDLLRTAPDPSLLRAEPTFWGSFVMAPWCNRVAVERAVRVGRRTLRLPFNFPDGTAIHGQVFDRPWRRIATDPSPDESVATSSIEAGGDAWPWPYEVTQRVEARAAGVGIELVLTNRADDPMPAGVGIHPWFVRPLRLSVDASEVFESNVHPSVGPVEVAGRLDLRRLAEVPDDLDGCWTGGAGEVLLEWPALDVAARMRADAFVAGRPLAPYVAVASPRGLGAVAVEPQTHAPYGLRRLERAEPGALALLMPGETLSLSVDLSFRRAWDDRRP